MGDIRSTCAHPYIHRYARPRSAISITSQNPHCGSSRCSRIGPIPAGTGETWIHSSTGSLSGAYPRRHGGNMRGHPIYAPLEGLSPQARGKPSNMVVTPGNSGPIPAGTGETVFLCFLFFVLRAYPRRHGGNSTILRIDAELSGLSPQARGKLIRLHVLKIIRGPIPAGTGETWLT